VNPPLSPLPVVDDSPELVLLLEEEPVAMGVFDAETLRIVAVNEAAVRAYGYSREDFAAMTIEDLHAPEELPRLRAGVRAEATPLRSTGVWKHRRKDGTIAHVNVASHACEFGGRPAWLVCGTDITHAVETETALRQSEWRYRHLVENANDLIVTVDLEDVITHVNAAFERALGYERFELLGESLTRVVAPEFHPALELAIEAKLAGAVAETTYELEFVARDGRRVPVMASSRLIDNAGAPAGIQAICRDLSERREAELRHRALIEALPLVTYEERPRRDSDELETVFVSSQVESLFGYPAEEWIGTGLWETIIHPDDRERVLRDFDGAAHRGERISGEYRLIATDGRAVWVLDEQVPVLDPQGRLERTQGFLLDVTDRHRAEDALRDSEERYRELVENADDLIATVDLDERITSVNAAFERLVGYPRDALVGQSLLGFIPEEWHPVLLAATKLKVSGETERSVHEHELLTRDGTRVPVEVSSRLTHERGVPIGIQAVLRDLSARKAAESALRDSERRQRELIESLPLVTYARRASDADGTLETGFISPQIEQLTGYPPADWIGTDIWDRLVHPDDYPRAIAELYDGAASDGPVSSEYRMRTASGDTAWVLDVRVPQREGESSGRGAQGFMLDVTARHRAEGALRASEELFRTGFENAAIGMMLASPDGSVMHGNAALCELLGYTDAELRSLSVLDLNHPDDRDASREAIARLQDESLARFAAEKRYLRKDGSPVWVQIDASPIRDESARITCYITQVHDVTARRQSEERFRRLFDSSPHGMNVADRDGRLLAANDALTQMLGYESGALLGRTFAELTHPDDVALDVELFGELIAGTRQSYGMEKRFLRADGSVLAAQLTAFALPDPSGKPQLAIGMVEDVGERKLLEEQLRRSQRLEAVGQLAGGVAHDFNNLLTAIASYADLADQAIDAGALERQRASIDGIRTAAGNAADLTRQLLAFSRRQVLELSVVDINEIVAEQAPLLERLIGETIEVRLALDSSIPPVTMDAGQLAQVLMNLAVNARDAMPEGGLLTVETQHVVLDNAPTTSGEISGPHVLVAVSDTGCGMQPGVAERIFEPFFTTKDPGRGTGLGLSTVLGIVEQAGGRVTVYSEPGSGTVFKIYLPSADGASTTRRSNPVASESRPPGRERILLVEDNDAVRGPVADVLSQLGYDVVAAASPAEALEWTDAEDIELLVTDVVMPGMSGRELAETLLARRPETKVLYMSGYTDDAVVSRGAIGPGTAFLQKPFGADRLAQRIRELLDA
jgi:two-component system, cell cycle sensor histidine kinase and response regulator CckA